MKIYHTATQEDYDALMVELEAKGVRWASNDRLDYDNNWNAYKENTYIVLENGYIAYGDLKFCQNFYPETPIVDYKANSAEVVE